MAAGNMDESVPPRSLLLYKHSSSPVMDETGRTALFMGAESDLPVCPHTAQWMLLHWGGEDIWHWNELHACNRSSGDRKWLQFVIWTFQRWKWGRPPEPSWVRLLFQSCSSSSTGCWSRALEVLLTCNVLWSGTDLACRGGRHVPGQSDVVFWTSRPTKLSWINLNFNKCANTSEYRNHRRKGHKVCFVFEKVHKQCLRFHAKKYINKIKRSCLFLYLIF